MHPILPAGSIVAVDRSVTDPAKLHGQIVAACPEGVPMIRWLDVHGRHIILRPNHNVGRDYPLIPVEFDAQAQVIIGQVVWSWSRFGQGSAGAGGSINRRPITSWTAVWRPSGASSARRNGATREAPGILSRKAGVLRREIQRGGPPSESRLGAEIGAVAQQTVVGDDAQRPLRQSRRAEQRHQPDHVLVRHRRRADARRRAARIVPAQDQVVGTMGGRPIGTGVEMDVQDQLADTGRRALGDRNPEVQVASRHRSSFGAETRGIGRRRSLTRSLARPMIQPRKDLEGRTPAGPHGHTGAPRPNRVSAVPAVALGEIARTGIMVGPPSLAKRARPEQGGQGDFPGHRPFSGRPGGPTMGRRGEAGSRTSDFGLFLTPMRSWPSIRPYAAAALAVGLTFALKGPFEAAVGRGRRCFYICPAVTFGAWLGGPGPRSTGGVLGRRSASRCTAPRSARCSLDNADDRLRLVLFLAEGLLLSGTMENAARGPAAIRGERPRGEALPGGAGPSEAQLLAILDNSPSAIFLKDRRGPLPPGQPPGGGAQRLGPRPARGPGAAGRLPRRDRASGSGRTIGRSSSGGRPTERRRSSTARAGRTRTSRSSSPCSTRPGRSTRSAASRPTSPSASGPNGRCGERAVVPVA